MPDGIPIGMDFYWKEVLMKMAILPICLCQAQKKMTCNFFQKLLRSFTVAKLHELFRRTCIKHFEDNKLINKDFARNLLSWKNSGFSIDNSVRLFSSDDNAKEALAQYIARCPIALDKIKYEPQFIALKQ